MKTPVARHSSKRKREPIWRQYGTDQALVPKMGYPYDGENTEEAAKRRRYHQIRESAKTCLSLYDLKTSLREDINDLQILERRINQHIKNEEADFEELAKAPWTSFLLWQRYGPYFKEEKKDANGTIVLSSDDEDDEEEEEEEVGEEKEDEPPTPSLKLSSQEI